MRMSNGSPVKQFEDDYVLMVNDSKQTTYAGPFKLEPAISKLGPSKQVTLEVNIKNEQRKTKLQKDDTFKLNSQMTFLEAEPNDFG